MTKELNDLRRRVSLLQGILLLAFVLLLSAFAIDLVNQKFIFMGRLVETKWSGDTLRLSSFTKPILITGLAQNGVVAKLPGPILTVNSEGASWELAELRKLKWCNEEGAEMSAPEPGSPVEALFIRLESSKFKP